MRRRSNGPQRFVVHCPNCSTVIPITEALHHQIAERCEAKVRDEMTRQQKAFASKEAVLRTRETAVEAAEAHVDARVKERLATERAALEDKVRATVRADVDVELADLRAVAAEKERKLKQLQQSELELRKQKRALQEQKQAAELDVEQQVQQRLSLRSST